MMHCAHLIAHGFIGIGSHSALYPPLVVPAIAPHIAMDTLLGLAINVEETTTVLGPFGLAFILQGSDSGYIVPHIAIPPPSVLLPVVIAFGGSKPMFAASTVIMQGKPVAAAVFPVIPLSINQACNDPCNYPSDIVICPNSVLVGLTLGDILGGLLSIAIDCVISRIANKVGDMAKGVLSNIGARLAAPFLREFTGEMTEAFGRETAEQMTRDAGQNIMERVAAQRVLEVLGKITENALGKLIDYDLEGFGAPKSGDLGSAAGAKIDSLSGTAATMAANSQDFPGAAPIHSAE